MHKIPYFHIVFILLGCMVSIYPVCALSASEFLTQGNDFYAKGDYKNALDSYNKSIAIDDQNYIAWNNRGNAFFQLNDSENAYQSYHRSIELNANNSLAWNGIGNSLFIMNRYSESVDAYNRAIAIQPVCER